MIKFLKILYILSIISLSLNSCKNENSKLTPVVKNGVIDLSGWNFIKNGKIRLDGDWEFYWKKFLTHYQLKTKDEPKNVMQVPGPWIGKKYNNKELGANGYATYRVKILLPEGEKNLALKIPHVGTAMTAFIDEKTIHSQGTIGTNNTTSIPGYKPGFVIFSTKKNQIDLILHISNYHYVYGGPWGTIAIGEKNNIERNYYSKLFLEFFLFGSLLIMAFYHIFMYSLRTKYKATLYFSFYCFIIALRTFLTGEKFLFTYTDLNWTLLVKLDFLTFYFGLLIFLLFIYKLFSNETYKIINNIYFIIASIYCLIVIFTPVSFLSTTLTSYQILTFFIGIYIFYILAKALMKKRDGALILLLGYILLFIAAIHDMLYYQQLVKTTDLIPIALFFFIFSQAGSISLQFSKAFTEVENLSGELKIKISDLEEANKIITLSEKKYRVLVEGTKDIIFTLDENWNFKSANQSLQTDLNVDPDNLQSLNFLDLIYQESENSASRDIVREKLEQLSPEKNVVYFKTNFKSSISSESREMAVALEYIKTEEKYEIIGKIFRVIEDELLKYFVSESQEFKIENFLTICADISQRLTRNIGKYIPKEEIKYIQLALREMIINAIEHGNLNISFEEKSEILFVGDYMGFISKRQQDPKYKDKKISINYSIKEDELVYTIEDEGKGFDHEPFIQRGKNDIDSEIDSHGRGIAMTMKVFDVVKYNDKGNKVTLIKKIRK